MGPIAGQWLKAQTKREILTVIATSQQQGVSARRSCAILVIAHRRIVRWQAKARQGQNLTDLTPGPKAPLHRVLPEEIEQIVALAKSAAYGDLSHPGRHGVGSRPLPGLLLHRLPGPQSAEPDGGPRSGRHPQRSLQSAGPQSADRAQPALVLGHQLPADVPERGVSLPLPAARRVVPQGHPMAHQLAADRRGIPASARRRLGGTEHPGPAGGPTARSHQRPRSPDESPADPAALRRPRPAPVVCAPPHSQ